MAKIPEEVKVTFRTWMKVKHSFKKFILNVSEDKRVRFAGKYPSDTSIFNALVMYLDTLTPAQQADAIAIGMARVNALIETGVIPARTPEDVQEPDAGKTASREVGVQGAREQPKRAKPKRGA